MKERKITFVGAGNIAHAIISGLISHGYSEKFITACAPSNKNLNYLIKKYRILSTHDNCDGCRYADIIIFAVKPQIIKDVLISLKNKCILNNKLILSVVAGITSQYYQKYLEEDIKLVRIMPNIGCTIGYGVTCLYAMDTVTRNDRFFVSKLFKNISKIFWISEESLINKIIAITSSSPAYFFLFMEYMQKEAEKLGFNKTIAKKMIMYTAQGSIKLACKSRKSFMSLKKQVTSNKGTTAKALEKFYAFNMEQIISDAMHAAIIRAEEMEKQF